MKINTEIIKNLKPCKDRLKNYLEHYANFDGTIKDFVLLNNITYNDKIWVITKLFTKEQNVAFAIKCAGSVLHSFEEKFPYDKRPRLALETAEAWLNNPTQENADAACAAAYAADAYDDVYAAYASAAAYATARAAVYAAANAAAYAAHADAYADAYADVYAAYAAYATARAADVVDAAEKETQLELNLIFAVEVANG